MTSGASGVAAAGYSAAHRRGLLDPGIDRVVGVFQRFHVGGAVGHAAGKIGDGGQISAAVAFTQRLNDDREAVANHRFRRGSVAQKALGRPDPA
jgi:hypothetical protein